MLSFLTSILTGPRAPGITLSLVKVLLPHLSFGDPVCPHLRDIIAEGARAVVEEHAEHGGKRVVDVGTYVNMEGPAFSTRAESNLYRSLGFDVIGMTSLPEAKLCREAELCYQNISMVTDYDSWHESEEPVTAEMVIGHLVDNTAMAKAILKEVIVKASRKRICTCASSLEWGYCYQPRRHSR